MFREWWPSGYGTAGVRWCIFINSGACLSDRWGVPSPMVRDVAVRDCFRHRCDVDRGAASSSPCGWRSSFGAPLGGAPKPPFASPFFEVDTDGSERLTRKRQPRRTALFQFLKGDLSPEAPWRLRRRNLLSLFRCPRPRQCGQNPSPQHQRPWQPAPR